MKKEIDNLRQKLAGNIQAAATGSFYGVVKKVDEDKRTCDVEVGNIVREKVLLYLLDDPDKRGWCFIPKKDSMVLVSKVDAAGTRLRVSMFSEIEKVICRIDDVNCSITSNGYTMNRGGSGLLKTLTDLCSALEKLTVTTAMGPSGTPINVAEFTAIKNELKNYLEDNNAG